MPYILFYIKRIYFLPIFRYSVPAPRSTSTPKQPKLGATLGACNVRQPASSPAPQEDVVARRVTCTSCRRCRRAATCGLEASRACAPGSCRLGVTMHAVPVRLLPCGCWHCCCCASDVETIDCRGSDIAAASRPVGPAVGDSL